MKDGSGKWLPSRWDGLLRKALSVLDSLEDGPGAWTFGGGIALARILDHRVGYDIDIFLDSSAVLKQLTPNANRMTRSLCNAWEGPGRHLKLVIEDAGEIIFRNAPTFTDDPTCRWSFEDRWIPMERPAEIATKKLFYRASAYTPRDAFDLAAIYLHDRSSMIEIARCPTITERIVLAATNRLNLAKDCYQSEMRNVINATERGEQFIDRTCEIALEALSEIRNLIPKEEPEPSSRITGYS